MNQIKKHAFEAVSLLTAANGMLKATIIPAINQPDWIVPSSLILDSIEDSRQDVDKAKFYLWQQQPVAVFRLLPTDQLANSVFILEGNSVEQRLALKTKGQSREIEVSISEVQDCELPKKYRTTTQSLINDSDANTTNTNTNTDLDAEVVSEDQLSSYLFQTILINETVYMVPDLDKIVHQLINETQA
ncbi:hypothetical protein M0N77_00865 [Psychrobacter sp. AH5]|uniref:hypothetical protein n=1 Tax=Psychrobacter sp. AH5 TaxID=2937433 RepID=UPI00333FE1D3